MVSRFAASCSTFSLRPPLRAHDEPSFRTRHQVPGHALLGHERAFSGIASNLRFHSGWTGYTELGNQCPFSRRPPTSTCGPLSADAREPPRTLAAPQRRQTTDSTQIPLARSLPPSFLCQPYLASLIVPIWITPEYGWLSIRFQAAPSACGRDFPPRADSRGPHFVVESPAVFQQKGISVEKQVGQHG